MSRLARLSLGALCFVSLMAAGESLRCNSGGTCRSLIDYVSPNATTVSSVAALFGVPEFRSVLGANGLPDSTPASYGFTARQTIRIPFPCRCQNGTGISDRVPVYTVVSGDDLDHIARNVFSALVTYQEIQAVNNISDASLIFAGQRLRIPLPCSCDEVGGSRVVHYGHLVETGNTVSGIAEQYNTSEETLLDLNGMNSSSVLLAGAVLDVPLRACSSMVSNRSIDYPLLVPNGTYVFTATSCVKCQCSAVNWTLQCQPSGINSTTWASCPSMQCQGAETLSLGSTTTSSCNQTTCAYTGYNNQTVLTVTALLDTCPANGVPRFGVRGWWWNELLVAVLLFVHLLQ